MEKPSGAHPEMHREDTRGNLPYREAQGGWMPRDTQGECTGMLGRDSQGHIWHREAQGKCPERQSLHRDAQGELSRGWTCYWLRLRASRKGGGQPLLSGFLPSQVIHT